MRIFHLIKKRVLAIALALVLFIPLLAVVDLSTTAKPVSADGETETVEEVVLPETDADDMFDFAPGASITKDLERMYFEIRQKDTKYDDRMNWTGECSVLRFTLYHYNVSLKKASAKCEIVIFSQRESVSNARIRTRVIILAKEIEDNAWASVSPFSIYPKQLVDEDIIYRSDFSNAKYCDNRFLKLSGFKDYKIIQEGIRWTDPQGASEPNCNPFEFDDSGATPVMRVAFVPEGKSASYFLKADYEICLYDEGLTNAISGSLTSPARSVYGVLSTIQDKGMLEQEFTAEGSLARAQDILAQASAPKEISLHYLEEIEGTYFAVEKTATVAVPVVDGELGKDDVKEALGKETLRVQNSYVAGFEANDDQTEWTARYYSSVHLRTKVVDGGGHYIDMFLDLNKSYGDYYQILASTIANGQELYGYMWSEFTAEYPMLELDAYNPDNVHGFFGVVWIPERSAFESFNAAAAALFNVKNEEFGFIKAFRGYRPITYKEHTDLMTAYNYSWMATAWSKIANFATLENVGAEYYFFAAKPMSYTGISQTGDTSKDDDDGALGNVIRDPLNAIGGLIGDFFGLNAGPAGIIKRISSLLIVAGVVVAGWYLWKKWKDGGAGVVSAGKTIAKKKSKSSTKKSKKKK